MMYINKVVLENFQSHEYTEIEFDLGLNVILGKSDSGKTAIIRAIKWALYNEPLGDYFLREQKTSVSVTVYFNNGVVVKRFRSKSKNSYYLKDCHGEEFNFEGFRNTIPKEVLDATGMYKINLDAKEESIINIAEQLEGAFLLNEKDSVKASAIGRLVHVNYIDDALRDTIRDLRNINTHVSTKKSERDSKDQELKNYEYLVKYEKILKTVEKLRNIIERKSEELSKLKNLKEEYELILKDKDYLEKKYIKLRKVEDIQEKYNKLFFNISKYNKLKNINTKYYENIENIKAEKHIKDKLKNLDQTERIFSEIEAKNKKNKNLVDKLRQMILINREIDLEKLLVKNLKDLPRLEKTNLKIQEKAEYLNRLNQIKTRFNEVDKSLKIGNNFMLKFKDMDKVNIKYSSLKDKSKKLKLLENLNREYKLNMSERLKALKVSEESKTLLKEKVTAYNEIVKRLEVCPYCFSKIDENTVEHIKKHYELLD